MSARSGRSLTVRPLTPELWPALEDLFGPGGASHGCWCMCFYVRRGYRRQGVAADLIEAALRFAKEAGASVVDAYPVDTAARGATSNTFTGTASTFARAGFRTIADRSSGRRIMRHD